MGRIIHIAPARPGGVAHWLRVAAAVLAAAAAGIGLSRLIEEGPAPQKPVAQAPTTQAVAVQASKADVDTPAVPVAATDVVECPIQALTIAIDGGEARAVCMDATLVQQSGSVRTYLVKAGGAEGWTLRIDMVERAIQSASLEARDGVEYACGAARCLGRVTLDGQQPGGAWTLSVSDLRLLGRTPRNASIDSIDTGLAVINARLTVPSDEQVPGLACTGSSVAIRATDGSTRKFCGQGGAGVAIAEDGHRSYHFQDHEGRTLTVAVNAEQRVIGVKLDNYGCQGNACGGASTSSSAPDNDLAERTFFFGRTVLTQVGTIVASGGGPRPGLTLDGTLVMPGSGE
jgi:hypothetical protein